MTRLAWPVSQTRPLICTPSPALCGYSGNDVSTITGVSTTPPPKASSNNINTARKININKSSVTIFYMFTLLLTRKMYCPSLNTFACNRYVSL